MHEIFLIYFAFAFHGFCWQKPPWGFYSWVRSIYTGRTSWWNQYLNFEPQQGFPSIPRLEKRIPMQGFATHHFGEIGSDG